MNLKEAKKIYQKRGDHYSRVLSKCTKDMYTISILRFITAASTVGSTIFLYRIKAFYSSWGAFLLGTAVFIYLVIMYKRLGNKHQFILCLKEINIFSGMRLDGSWIEFEDKGLDFIDEEHNFSHDLDIFGQGSLFQWINTAATHMGRSRLANTLMHPSDNKERINKRQQSIDELSKKIWWRQRLQAEAKMISVKDKSEADLLNWANNKNELLNRTWMILIIRLLPVITVFTLLLAFWANRISGYIPLFLLFTQAFMILLPSFKIGKEFALVYQYHHSIKAYRRIIKHFEKTRFQTVYLNELRERLANKEGFTAVEQLRKLEILLDRILNRNNMVFFPVNVITLWDYQCMIDLERWRRQSGQYIEEWLEVIGELEALSSLSVIRHDYPHWAMPVITGQYSTFHSKSLGHPLLTNKQVLNDITIREPSRILLITGPNMSGKSTLLRTIGINLVLAYSGAPVCATSMRCSIFHIYTCMRISDNLEKGISSFYGELLRIKNIVNAAKKDKEVFFLLDEIFKGTNSYDRHIGAKTLIKQLYNHGATGLVSTHDLELGAMERESGGTIKNYHFQEYYQDNKIYFDYKLRKGISTTRNALYLIKMIGIEIDECEI